MMGVINSKSKVHLWIDIRNEGGGKEAKIGRAYAVGGFGGASPL